MKKQLLIAAVAASMTSVAMADLSISGKYEAVFSDTGTVSDDLDMKFVGKSDAGTVTMTSENMTGANGFNVTTAYLTTSVEGISVKAGEYKGQTGNGTTYKKSNGTGKISVSTSVAGMKIAHSNSDKTDISGAFGGVKVKMQDALNSSRTTSIATDIAGVAVTAEKNDDTTAFTLSTEVSGMTVTYVNVDAATCTAATATAAAVSCASQDDGLIGDIAGKHNVTGLNISTNTAAGKVTVKAMQSDEGDVTKVTLKRGNVAYTYNDASDTFSAKVAFKF